MDYPAYDPALLNTVGTGELLHDLLLLIFCPIVGNEVSIFPIPSMLGSAYYLLNCTNW